MNKDWQEYKFRELAEICYGKNQKSVICPKSDIPILGTGGLLGYATQYLYNKPSVLIGRKGTISKVQYIEKPFWTVDTLFYTKINKDLVYPHFLYYLLSTIDLSQYNEGTSIPSLRTETLNNIQLSVPSLSIQKAILNKLEYIDKEIQVNTQINDNLTQQVNAIYEYMFITNANPSWKTGKLSDIVTVRYGKDHKKLADGTYPVYGSGGIMRYVERPLYNKESVLIPRKGTLNNVIYVNQPFWSVDTMFYTEMRIPNVAKFVFNYVKTKNLSALNAGSAVPSMTTDILNAMELVIPSKSALEKFEEVVSPLYKEMQKNNRQSEILGKLRDVLLPRLISGEIVIP